MRCIECSKKAPVKTTMVERTTILGDYIFTYNVVALKCTYCSATYFNREAVKAIEYYISWYLVEAEETRGMYLKYMRKVAGLSRDELAKQLFLEGCSLSEIALIKRWEEDEEVEAPKLAVLTIYKNVLQKFEENSDCVFLLTDLRVRP